VLFLKISDAYLQFILVFLFHPSQLNILTLAANLSSSSLRCTLNYS